MAVEQGQPSIAAGGLTVDEQALHTLKQAVRGSVLRPAEDGFDSTRHIWNRMIDRVGAADVIAAVNFAREHNLVLAVRGGGHSAAGSSVCDCGLIIDLSLMKGIRLDPARRIARGEPGVTQGEFDRETQTFGLAITGGVVSTTGIAGLTLGGGVGS
jgi:FAD/FMN-containing dehydrogenase